LQQYYWHRQAPQPQPAPPYSLPYWERREKSGGTKACVRVGFVGADIYAQHHLKVLNSLEQVKIGAILTNGGPRGREAAARYSIEKTFTDMNGFLGQTDIDCFVVVVPTTTYVCRRPAMPRHRKARSHGETGRGFGR
jgi:hypothetical protein